MHTGFDILESSSALRAHWLRRFVAGIVDIVIVFVPIYFILDLLHVTNTAVRPGWRGPGVVPVRWLMEGRFGRTVGKFLVRQKVVSMGERRTYKQTFIRSIP